MVRRAIEIAMVVAMCASGCLAFDDVQCADGHLCPPGSRCDDIHGGCILPSQLQACANSDEGDPCEIDGAGGTCVNGGCVAWFCGDGMLNGGEACEGSDFGGMDCTSFGFTNREGLICTDACHIDRTACTGGCGDNIIDSLEDCDGTSIPAGTTCKDLGYYDEPGLKCSGFCTFDKSNCTGFCGDGLTNGPEQCDGLPALGESCLDYSFDAGRLGCTLCAPGFEGCTSFGWRSEAAPTTRTLRGIWGSSSSDFYVVGLAGTILHYNGSQLATVSPAPTSQDLAAIWGSAANDVYAVGGAGTIVHFDGSTWTSTTPASAIFSGVWGSGADDVYAVGTAGTVMHYTGTWAPVTVTGVGSNTLRAVWGTGGHVFVVGAGGTLAHYDGNSWTTTNIAGGADFYSVWGSGPTNVFASGSDPSGGILYRYNGATWTSVFTGPLSGRHTALWGSGATDAFAVGSTSILHHDGSKWTPLVLPSDVQAGTKLWAVWGSPSGDVWAAGDNGYVAHWGGASWTTTTMTPASSASLRGVSTFGTSDAIAVGLGAIGRYDGATWAMQNTVSASDQLFGVWATPGFAVAVGENTSAGIFYHWDGNNWTKMASGDATNCGALPSPGLRGVWGSSTSNIYAVGGVTSGAFRRFTTSCWSTPAAQPSSSSQLFGIFGLNATTAFATNLTGSVFSFDGNAWTTLPAMPSPAPGNLTNTWASSATDLFSVGDAIMHFDGTTWSRMTANGQFLSGVSGTGPRNVFASGDNGRLLHYDGISWTPIKVPVPASPATYLRSVAATSRSVIVVGDNGFVQRLSFSLRQTEINCRDGWDDDGDGMPDCADSDCASDGTCARGGACPVIDDLECGKPITGTTLGRTPGRDYYTCDANAETGPEAIYRIVPPGNGTATATLSAFGTAELDLVVVGSMAASDGCDPDAACRGASSNDGAATEAVTFATTAGKPQFVIVEGRNAAAGPFTLTVTCP